MGVFRQFPYTNFHDLNLDWVLRRIKELWQGVGDLDEKVDNFITETEPIIKDEVDKWLDEHPEATTTVEDGSLTLPKFSDELKEDVILNNEVGIHKRKAVFINNNKYCPDDHVCNGFTADKYFFYIAHHVSDSEPLFITKVNKTDFSSITYETPLTGHGNTLSIMGNNLYVCNSSTGVVDVLNKNNLSIIVGSFKPDPQVNGFSIKKINNRIVTCASNVGNTLITNNQVVDGYSTPINRIKLESAYNCYMQGIDHTTNAIYYSRSYGQEITEWWHYPTIDAYAYSGRLLNRVYVIFDETEDSRDIEIEDIYRDSENNTIYYVTASGRIGFIDTVNFTTAQTTNGLEGYSLRSSECYPVVITNNEDPQVTWRGNTQLAVKIRKNPFSTIYQGFGIGNGLIAGQAAIFMQRGSIIFGFTIGYSATMGYVNYEYDNTENVLKLQGGGVYTRQTGNTLRIQDINEYSDENPTRRTTINLFSMMPLTVPFSSANPYIPTDEVDP